MIAIDTQEKLDCIMNALEDREIVLDNRKRTKEDDDEVCREIAEYKAMRQETPAELINGMIRKEMATAI